jgi:hypothetical protein
MLAHKPIQGAVCIPYSKDQWKYPLISFFARFLDGRKISAINYRKKPKMILFPPREEHLIRVHH